MPTAQKRIRKTIAFPEEVLAILRQKAQKLGLSTVDYIRFIVLKEAEGLRDINGFTPQKAKELEEAKIEAKNSKGFSSVEALMNDLDS